MKMVMMTIFAVLCTIILGSYAHAKWFTPVKWFKTPFVIVSEHNRKAWEKDVFSYVKFTLHEHLSGHKDLFCQYDLELPKPKTISLSKGEINRVFNELYPKNEYKKVNGFYEHKTQTVYYTEGRWSTLAHEYSHYFAWNTITAKQNTKGIYMLPNARCLDELVSGLIGENYLLRSNIRSANQRIRNLRRAIRKKR